MSEDQLQPVQADDAQMLATFALLVNQNADMFASPANYSSFQSTALALITALFNNALSKESWQSPIYQQLLSQLHDEKPMTRAQKRKAAKVDAARHVTTPLNSLYVPEDGRVDDEVLWQQLELRHKNLDLLAKRVLGHPTTDTDVPETDKQGMQLDADLEALEQDIDLDEEDADDQDSDSSFEESGPSDVELESEFSDNPANESYQPLNGNSPPSSKLTIRIPAQDAPSTRKHRPSSEVDDEFFNLDEFEEMTGSGEKEMERLMKGGSIGQDELDLDEGIDMFAPLSGRPKDTLMDGSDEEDSDADDLMLDADDLELETAPDLQDVADVTYDTFFLPPRNVPLPKASTSQLSQFKQPEKITEGDSSRRSQVRFSETVRVKNMPARKKKGNTAMLDAQLKIMAKEMGVNPEDLRMTEEDDDSAPEDGLDDVKMEDAESIDEDFEAEIEESRQASLEEEEDDEDNAISRLKTDLFGDQQDQSASEDENLSHFEKKQKALAAKINILEQENVAPKSWTLTGEARAKDRPLNSLLEQDLEFEHTGKLVPQVTVESTLSLEEKIRARILTEQWDDVERKLEFDPKAFLPSQLLDIPATQSGKSLAELYADEYSAERQRAEGNQVEDERDAKLKAKHEELEGIFEGICAKLDALSNAHFTPKAPKTQIQSISNTSKVAMESALPATTSEATLLAPEEVYKPASNTPTGADTSDLGSLAKKALRRKQRQAKMKQKKKTDSFAGGKKLSAEQEKEQARKKLIGTRGVHVIGKKREAGDEKKNSTKGAKQFKL